MPIEIVQFIEEYGLSAGILLLLIIVAVPLLKWIISINKLVAGNINKLDTLKERVDTFHLDCHVPVGAVKALEDKVGKLEIKDTELDGDVKEINEHLKSLDTTVELIHTSIDKVDKKIDQMMIIQLQNAK